MSDHPERHRVCVEIDPETDVMLSQLVAELHQTNKAAIMRQAVKVFADVWRWQKTGKETEIVVEQGK